MANPSGILPATLPRAEGRARLAVSGVITREAHVLRRFMPPLLLLAILVAGCGNQAPALTDPKEIISQGLAATGQAKSLHVDVVVSGSIAIPQTGGTFNLEGTTAGGDFDIANERAQLTFKAPGLFGLSGEAIVVGDNSYVKSSLTGPLYVKSTSADSGVPLDADTALDKVESFLDEEGVTSEKLDDVTCGDRSCYAVRVTIPASLLSGASAAGIDAGDYLGDSLVLDLWFDRDNVRLRQASTEIAAGELGTVGLLVTFSRYDATFEVSPPPDDQVTTEAPSFP